MNFRVGPMSFSYDFVNWARPPEPESSSESDSDSDSDSGSSNCSNEEKDSGRKEEVLGCNCRCRVGEHNKFPSEKNSITPDKVAELEKILDYHHVISLVFLLYDTKHALQNIIVLLASDRNKIGTDKITNWINTQPINWQSKLLEALTVIQNYQAVIFLGFNKQEVNDRFQPMVDIEQPYICRVKRMLYKLSKNMTLEESRLLVNLICCDDKFKVDYNIGLDKNSEFLEFHFLYLHEIGYINIEEEGLDLANLTKHFDSKCLANNEMLKLKVSDVNKMVKDIKTHHAKALVKESYPIKNPRNVGLMIIMNMENFHVEEDPNYKHLLPQYPLDNRPGTMEDVKNLGNTFTNRNFKVVEIHDVKSYDFEKVVDNTLKENFEKDHSVLFLCVLSHGSKGVVYCANSIPISIDRIKNTLCITETAARLLKGKPKVVIIQACQGDNKLYVEPKAKPFKQRQASSGTDSFSLDNACSSTLATRSSYPKHSPDFTGLMVCMAIIQGYSAVRCPQKGTFYIQELCKLVREHKNTKNFTDIVTEVHKAINNKPLHVKTRDNSGNCDVHGNKCMLIYMTPEILNFSFTMPLYF